jgi:uncharacterized tellurite resistance protein B-like protein
MLDALKRFFDRELATPADTPAGVHRLQVATAALLVEVMRLDGSPEASRRAILRSVKDKFGLSDAEADTLVNLAEAEARESVGHYDFTSLINQSYTPEQKARIVEFMWQVAYADAALSANEQHVIRKIADLLYIPHADYVAAKLRARDSAGGAAG